MTRGKRSDPTKLAKEREQIAQSQADLAKPRESTISLIGRSIMQGVDQFKQKMQRNKDRVEGYGSPPIGVGEIVQKGRRKRTVRDTSA